jgi:hypothetical protein
MFQYAYARERELTRGEKCLFDLYFFKSRQRMRKLKRVPHLHLYLADFNVRLRGVSVIGALFFRLLGRYYSGYPYGDFSKIRPQLLQEFSFKGAPHPFAEKILAAENSVAVHIRRGDYVGNKHYDIIGTDYFIRAARRMQKELKKPEFFIFSDDLDWVRKNIRLDEFGKVVFVDNRSPNADMTASSMARHHIIANSTFAWWCAWLNKNPNKIVITPRRWNSGEPENIKSSKINLREWISM